MIKKIQIVWVAGLVLLMCCSCIELNKSTDQAPKASTAAGVQKISAEKLPPDVQLVIAALLNKVRKTAEPATKVTFDSNGKHEFSDSFDYARFSATQLSITGHASEATGQDTAKTTLEGLVLFKDELDRSAGLYFAVQYTTQKQGIFITRSHTNPMPSDFPKIEAYIVPKSRFDKTAPNSLNTYSALYTFALDNAVSMVSKSRFIKKGIEDEFLFFVFCKDRLLDNSKLTMKVTTKKNMQGDKLIDPIYLSENGFRYFMGAGKFNTANSEHKFYIGVSYTLDPEKNDKPVLVANFDNQVR